MYRKDYAKKYRKNNPDKLKLWRQTYYKKHRKRLLVKSKKYRDENKELVNKRKRLWAKKHPEVKKVWQQKATANHKKLWYVEAKKMFGDLKCSVCGYDRCLDALDFHHKNPEQKKHSISNMFRWKVTAERKKELKKCVILCCRCHRELHAAERGTI